MLPFVRHRTLQIPHRLAALAAAICLALAFTSDVQTRLETLQAESASEKPVEVMVKVPEHAPSDQTVNPEPGRSGNSEQATRGLSNFLLPWLPRLR